MTLFEWLKLLHVGSVVLSVSGFILRGYWMMTDNPLLRRRPAKVLPHIVDIFLLGSAIGMLVLWRVSPFQMGWISAKIAGLLVYIALGMAALRYGKTRRQRVIAWLLALCTVAYIVTVAYSKDPLGFFRPLVG